MTLRTPVRALVATVAMAVIAPLALGVFSEETGVQAQEAVGYVASIDGTWMLADEDQPVILGQALRPGAVLVRADEGGAISVVLRDDRELSNCDMDGCVARVALPDSVEESGLFARVFDAVFALIAQRPRRFVTLATREDSRIRDAVALRDGQRVSLRDAMITFPRGRYYVDLVPVPLPDSQEPTEVEPWCSVETTWNRSSVEFVELPGIQPGVYDFAVHEAPTTGSCRSSGEARLLVLDAGAYGPALDALREVRGASRGWDAASRRTVLRALLDHLLAETLVPGRSDPSSARR